MASQIEQTVASLTALSEQYSTQLGGFFKKNDEWFQSLRSSTLANIKSAFRKIELHAAQNRSPVKSLRKKVRRKARKGPRIRKNKNKPNLRSPVVDTSGQRVDNSSTRTKDVLVSRPSRQLRINETTETELEAPSSYSPIPPHHPASESSKGEAESDMQVSSAIKKKHSNGTSCSTGSFYSAVDTGILPQSPPNEESQWEECRSKSELVVLESADCATNREIPEIGSGDFVGRVSHIADPSIEKDVLRKSQALEKDQDHIDEVSGGVDPDETTDETTKPSETRDIQNENPCELHITIEKDTSDASSEGGPSREGNLKGTLDSNLTQVAKQNEDGISTDPPYTALSAALQRKKKSETLKSSTDETKEKETLARRSSEPHESEQESEANKLHPQEPTGDQFEFKAPKPRYIPSGQSSRPGQGPVAPAADLLSIVHQTPTQALERSPKKKEKHHTLYQRHFAVDEGGKINDTGIGLLSEIASTPVQSAKGNGPDAPGNYEEGKTRGTKLFKPNNDIYSAQRKPTLSRVLSVQKSTLTSRGSLLSHTPGAHAPSTRLARDSTLSGVFTNSLRESLAALKQPITDRNLTHTMGDGEPPLEGTGGSQEPSFLREKEQSSLDVPVGKRLTFADGYKRQLAGGLSHSSREFEPQTAPTKEFRQPRIRRDTEKSALRRRIEEIRGKASSLSVPNQASPRASSSNSFLDNLSSHDKDGEESNTARTDSIVETGSGAHQRERKSSRSSTGSTEAEKVATKIGFETIPIDSEARDRVSSDVAENENGENEETNSRLEEKETGIYSAAEGEMEENRREIIELDGEDEGENGKEDELELAQDDVAPRNILSNLMTSVSSLYSGSSILGTRAHEEKKEDADGEQAAKRQRLDAERREAERLARMEAQRVARQKEAEEKQRRAEARRQLLAEAEKAKEDERKKKELHRKRIKQHEEEERKRKKTEEDRKKEERRRQVLEKRAMNLELQAKRKPVDGKRQRQMKMGDRGMSSIPKPNGLGGKSGKGYGGGKHIGRHGSPEIRDEEKEMNNYKMTPAKATEIEESDEETERRKGKTIPEWAGERNLAISARSQPDPDKVFVNMPMCNLRDVFGNQKQYRTRSSSANWTQDRVTSSEMTRYKKAVGGFRDA